MEFSPIVLNISLKAPQESSYVSSIGKQFYAVAILDGEALPNVVKLPTGRINIKDVFKLFGEQWIPDIIHVSSTLAACQKNILLTGLENLDIPSILKLSDSHHMFQPIRKNVSFAKLLQCKHHYSTFNRQHIHFYQCAGLKNVMWLPGSLSINPKVINLSERKINDIVFCGSLSNIHPYRSYLINKMLERKINLQVKRLPYFETLELYNKSVITFNCSLNGDLNRRVFETMMAGGFLLTDKLSVNAGIETLFTRGVHFDDYSSSNELLEKIDYYLSERGRNEAFRIGSKSQQTFLNNLHPDIINKDLYKYLLMNGEAPSYYFDNSKSKVVNSLVKPKDYSIPAGVYETIQELHRINNSLNILDLSDNQYISTSISDLPRVKITHSANSYRHNYKFDIGIISSNIEEDKLKSLLRSLHPDGIIIMIRDNNRRFNRFLESQLSNFRKIYIQDFKYKYYTVYRGLGRLESNLKVIELTKRSRLYQLISQRFPFLTRIKNLIKHN